MYMLLSSRIFPISPTLFLSPERGQVPFEKEPVSPYELATISRLPKNIGFSCKRALWKRLYSAKETCSFKEPTNHSHPICTPSLVRSRVGDPPLQNEPYSPYLRSLPRERARERPPSWKIALFALFVQKIPIRLIKRVLWAKEPYLPYQTSPMSKRALFGLLTEPYSPYQKRVMSKRALFALLKEPYEQTTLFALWKEPYSPY